MSREIEDIIREAIDCGFRIHRAVGPGLFESVYETLLADCLERRGLTARRQVGVPFEFEGRTFPEAFRADLLVEHRLLIEVKSVERQVPVHAKQLLTYLRVARFPLGLLMNFGLPTFKEGVQRIANNYQELKCD
ncbi:MAG TPA: GxxExxY protein [Alphaproteobacteria bacterium]|nr:GxxExxY protein [Alphaproteobacteria bacterium]HAJ46282.1 GxxExxY protein [Alphaproteobacteria bacterium]